MRGSESNKSRIAMRNVFVFATMLVILLSPCSIRAASKTMAGLPVQHEHSSPKQKPPSSVKSLEECDSSRQFEQGVVVDKGSFTHDFLSAARLLIHFS